jgi:hypothetical protein
MFIEFIFYEKVNFILRLLANKNINLEAFYLNKKNNEYRIVIIDSKFNIVNNIMKQYVSSYKFNNVYLVDFQPIPGQIISILERYNITTTYMAENNRFVLSTY